MSSEKSNAIVLRTIDFSETSLVVTLLTEDFGKVSALAKGARRPKGPFDAALDLLSICRVVFIRKSSTSLDLLTEAKLDRRFRAASGNLAALNAGYYVAEMLRELTDDHDPHPKLFKLACETLIELDSVAAGQNQQVMRRVLRFEMVALRVLGHLPAFDDCVGCGKKVGAAPRVSFGLIAGGVLCDGCRQGKRQVASVSAAAIGAMRSFAEEEQTDNDFKMPPAIAGELRGLLNRYICNLLGKRPKTQKLLEAIK